MRATANMDKCGDEFKKMSILWPIQCFYRIFGLAKCEREDGVVLISTSNCSSYHSIRISYHSNNIAPNRYHPFSTLSNSNTVPSNPCSTVPLSMRPMRFRIRVLSNSQYGWAHNHSRLETAFLLATEGCPPKRPSLLGQSAVL